MFPFIEELDQLAYKAKILIEQGEYKKALRIAKKLDRSPYSEGWVHACRLMGQINMLQGDLLKAKEEALVGLNNAWGDAELLRIMRSGNGPVTSTSKTYVITLLAGVPAAGPLFQFGPEFEVTFVAVAEDEFEAMRHIKETANVLEGHEPKVRCTKRTRELPENADLRGVYGITPFSRIRK